MALYQNRLARRRAFGSRPGSAIAALAAGLLATTSLTHAQTQPQSSDALDLGAVGITGTGDTAVGNKAKPGSAPAVAPTQSSLYAIEPQSIVSDQYIQQVVPPGSDWTQDIKLVPGFSFSAPNGPGGEESKNMQVRGFQDGQFNVTYDGIPFGDANDPSHHSTAFFPGSTVDKVIVDRGPGEASTIGYATFGGTVAMYSPELSDKLGANVQASYGSYNTINSSATLQSGKLNSSGTEIMGQVNHFTTNGAIDMQYLRSDNILLKLRQPIGDRFVVTLFSSFNNDGYGGGNPPTEAEVQQFGKQFDELNTNPHSSYYSGDNYAVKQTDFEYIDITGDVGFFQFDTKGYTYGYKNEVLAGTGTLGATAVHSIGPNSILLNNANDVVGTNKRNNYRFIGDVVTLSHDFTSGWLPGELRIGNWIEHTDNRRSLTAIDFTPNGTYNGTQGVYYVPAPSAKYGHYVFTTPDYYDIDSKIDTLMPFIEYEWKPTSRLSIIPGFKHIDYTRGQFATLNQDANKQKPEPVNLSLPYSSNLALFTARYRATNNLSFYGEAAQGWLVPSVADTYNVDPLGNQDQPSTTTNYQAGFVWKSNRVTADADVYYIIFKNLVQTVPDPTIPGGTISVDQGGVDYKGIEGEATVVVGSGFSVYGNATANSAKSKVTDLWIAEAPDVTGAVGLLYSNHGWFGSVISKYIGQRYAGSGQLAGSSATALRGYSTTDAVIGVNLKDVLPRARDIKLQFGINNVFNYKGVIDTSGATTGAGAATQTAATNAYTFEPGRGAFVSISASF